MSRVFAYCRVSTLEQTTENQRREIEAAGFAIRSQRLIEEHISGSVAASERPGFIRLLDRMENGDVLIVTKLDRLGRNAMDIRKTVEQLAALDIRVHCLALGGVDLTSPAGKMTMQVISAVAGTVAKLAMRQPFVLFKGLTFQKLCLPGAFRPGDHHNKMLRPGLCVVHASPQYL